MNDPTTPDAVALPATDSRQPDAERQPRLPIPLDAKRSSDKIRARIYHDGRIRNSAGMVAMVLADHIRYDVRGRIPGAAAAAREGSERAVSMGPARLLRRFARPGAWSTVWSGLLGFLDANERQPRLCGDHDVGHVGVAGAALFDHRDVGRVDEDVAVAVVALELHQVHRLPPTRRARPCAFSLPDCLHRGHRDIMVQTESDQTGFPGSLVAYALS